MDASAETRPDAGTGPDAPTRVRRVAHEITHDLVRAEDLRGLRSDLVAWVRATAGCPEGPALADRLDDVATALYEALTNVVDHAYPQGGGPLRVTARLTVTGGVDEPAENRAVSPSPWLEIEVADRGGWRPAPADPGHRGRGLQLLAGLSDGHDVQRDPGGTHVLLWWHRPP
ncbi:ATP-binding protein [Actinomycetospora cinnamomea]|uniref:Anti-sigma regulatory factor (Ser/Thr protein kinase) n=1 Tax=Actinomycetospora cinnamomea TaxID=663609 RepID=A0A2U1FBN4_9PSEU|nr:ATP-binding protein [Actinomycetospora cinnamomea]PVZ09574.1 anti-sigma regulatory factor (Ser/Thr protein kinase) [Actinomycetospora cinnamomea]